MADKFDLSKYDTVASRIPKFYEKYPAGRIITDLASDINKLDIVVFKASVYDAEILLATGWAFEKEGNGYVNKTSHVENCETSAIGRALANIGISGDLRPSREEMEKVQRHSNSGKVNSEKSESKATLLRFASQDSASLNKITGNEAVVLNTLDGAFHEFGFAPEQFKKLCNSGNSAIERYELIKKFIQENVK